MRGPVGCSLFPNDFRCTSRRWTAEKRFGKLWLGNDRARGCQCAAFERPAVFVDELRTCFRGRR